MIVYISGKISGLTKEEYTQNFFDSTDFVFNNYSENTINPLDIKPLFGIKKYWFYMAADIWQLRKCTHIAAQKNWIDSKGAFIEVFLAKFIFKQQIIWL